MPDSSYFLLNPKNADVVEGRAAWRNNGRLGLIGLHAVSMLMLLMIGIGIGFFELRAFTKHRHLTNEGVILDGTITKLYTVSGDRNTRHSRIAYEFTAADQQLYYDSQQVNRNFYQTAHVGQSVQIRYLPSNPTISELVNNPNLPLIDRPTLLVAAIAVYGMFLLMFGYQVWSGLREYHHLQQGQVLAATLIDLQQTRIALKVLCEYHSPHTHRLTRSIGYGSVRHPTSFPSAGTRVCILYYNDQLYEVL